MLGGNREIVNPGELNSRKEDGEMKAQAHWDERYRSNNTPWETDRPDRNLERLLANHRIGPCSALEIGCGSGNNAIWLAGQGFQVTALDISGVAVSAARRKAGALKLKHAVKFLAANVLSDTIPGSPFQFVFDRGCFHSFETPEERIACTAAVHRLLAERGLWLSLIGSRDGPERTVGPPRWSAAEIAAAVEDRFEIIELSATHFDSAQPDPPLAWACLMRRRF